MYTESAYTPGPWRLATMGSRLEPPASLSDKDRAVWEQMQERAARPSRMNDGNWIVTAEDGQVAQVAFRGKAKRGQEHQAPDPEGEANATLIAAAPDLLEACKRALELKPDYAEPFILNAIAKAEGTAHQHEGE